MKDFILGTLPITLLELVAAIAGSYYLSKKKHIKETKYIVWLLWLTFFVELFSAYAPINYFTKYEYATWLEDSPFSRNYWLYNVFALVHYGVYIYYFKSLTKNKIWRLILNWSLVIFLLSAVIYLFVSDVFFINYSPFTHIFGTLLVALSIVLFFFELLKSEILLKLKYFMPIYISSGALMFHLCVTPVNIFSEYFSKDNTYFVDVKTNVMLFANVFLYGVYIIGFIICSRRKRYS